MVDRISTYTLASQINTNNRSLQARVAETQIQLSSGLKSTDYKGIAFESDRLLNYEGEFSRLDSYNVNITVAENRMSYTYAVIDNIIDRLVSFQTDLAAQTSAASGPNSDLAFDVTHNQNYQDLLNLLGTQQGGEYIFSGTASNIPPIDVTDPGFTAPFALGGPANATYYQGNNESQNIPVSEGITVNVGVSANESGFEKAIRAFRLVIDNPANATAVSEAYDLVNQAMDEVIAIRSRVASNNNTALQQRDLNSEEASFLQNAISDIRDIDIAEASVRSTQLSTLLEASYAVTVRLNQLTLASFIR
jgi:flagellar hook-associated protein 3 FlgL